MPTLYTVGHSNRSMEDFIEIVTSQSITLLVDVRTIPKSRRLPWFNKPALASTLRTVKIKYQHMPALGGLRHASKDSINQGWHNASFRGFADYMQSMDFFLALKQLNELIKTHERVAIMCAEAVPWRCHRSLIADAEVVRGVHVIHIMSSTAVREHELTSFAVVDRNKRPIKVYYPHD